MYLAEQHLFALLFARKETKVHFGLEAKHLINIS